MEPAGDASRNVNIGVIKSPKSKSLKNEQMQVVNIIMVAVAASEMG